MWHVRSDSKQRLLFSNFKLYLSINKKILWHVLTGRDRNMDQIHVWKFPILHDQLITKYQLIKVNKWLYVSGTFSSHRHYGLAIGADMKSQTNICSTLYMELQAR